MYESECNCGETVELKEYSEYQRDYRTNGKVLTLCSKCGTTILVPHPAEQND